METTLPITGAFAAVLAIMFVALSFNAGLNRVKSKISYLDGGDSEMARKMRAQQNFIEYVPIALILFALVELGGGSAMLVCGLGAALLVGRILHAWTFLTVETAIGNGRAIGMVLTIGSILGASGWLLYGQIAG